MAVWEKEERIRNELLTLTEEINMENALAQQKEEERRKAKTMDKEPHGIEQFVLDGEWVGFPDSNCLQSTPGSGRGTEEEPTGLPQPQAFAQQVSRQILETPITVSLGELLKVAPNITDYVKAKVFPSTVSQPSLRSETAQETTVAHPAQPIGKPTSATRFFQDSNCSQTGFKLDVGAVYINRGLSVISVQVGNSTLKNVLLDGGSGVNLITEEEQIRLGLKEPSLAPYPLRMADQAVVEPVGLIRNVRIHIHGIPYIISLTVIRNKEVNEAYSMLLGRP